MNLEILKYRTESTTNDRRDRKYHLIFMFKESIKEQIRLIENPILHEILIRNNYKNHISSR